MNLNEITNSVAELLAPYPLAFGVLYGYHTYNRELSVWSVKIAVYTDDDRVFGKIREMIDETADDKFNCENLKLINLKDASEFDYYEILMTGKPIFVKDQEFYCSEKARVMKGYFDFLEPYNKLMDYSVKLLERKIYG